MEKHVVILKVEKATKNKIRFQEEEIAGKPMVVESIYLPKWVVGDEEQVQVTVEPVKAKK